MIYDPDKKKFQSYCRCLSKAERVAATHGRRLGYRCKRDPDNRKETVGSNKQRGAEVVYANWEEAKAALYMDMMDARKNIEFNKWLAKGRTEALDA